MDENTDAQLDERIVWINLDVFILQTKKFIFHRKFDRDGSGYISPEELRYVVCNTGEKFSQSEAEELIDMFDVNKDGQLSWEEFVTFIKTSILELEDGGQNQPFDTKEQEDEDESNAVLENDK